MRAMKDSSVEWIGEIPALWDTMKIKHSATIAGRIGWQGLTSEEYCDEGAFLVTGINFRNGQIDWNSCVHVPMHRWEEASQIQINDGDLLITKDGTVGKVAIVSNMPAETSLNSGVLLIRPNNCNTKYLYWILQSDIFWKWFSLVNAGNSTIIHLYQNDFLNFSFPLPDKETQYRISCFLDAKCAKIDAIIAKQQEIIEKLKAYKLSVITEAVTKGLNPNVPMKDSEIEWCRCVPESWRRVKLKDICTFHNGDRSSNYPSPEDYVEEGIPFVGADSLWGDYVDTTISKHISAEKYAQMGGLKIRENDVLYTLRGSTIGKNAIAGFNEGTVASSLMGIRAKAMVNASFLYYWLNSNGEYMQRDMCINGSTAPNLSAEDVKLFVLYLPSTQEQLDIVAYIKQQCSKVDATIQAKEKVINKIAEYKKSLIYEVVTGKREV